MKRLSGQELEKHIKHLNSIGFTDVVKEVFQKINDGKENEITFNEVQFVLNKLKTK